MSILLFMNYNRDLKKNLKNFSKYLKIYFLKSLNKFNKKIKNTFKKIKRFFIRKAGKENFNISCKNKTSLKTSQWLIQDSTT